MDGSSVECEGEPIYYKSKDKQTLWCTVSERAGISNLPTTSFHISAKLTGKAACVNTAEECFSLFFTPSMLDRIVKLTNEKIKELEDEQVKDNSPTDDVEMKAFLGILILSGLYLYEGVKELWDTNGYGADIFRATLSFLRYQFLVKCFRYAPDTVDDVYAFLESFSENCQDNFELGSYATLENQLIPYRGQCPEVIIRRNNAICLLSVRDSRVNYTHACVLQSEDKDIKDQTATVTCKLRSPDRLLVADKSITTMSLVDYFSANDTFFLGQIKKNAMEIPPELTATDQVPTIIYHSNATLIRHVDKNEEPVFLLCNLIGVDTCLPDILETYDAVAGQGSAVDAMCKNYSCAKKTNRWDMAVFFRLLDIACINAQIIFTIASNGGEGLSRRQFIKKLSGELTKPHIATRVTHLWLPHSVRQAAAKIAYIPFSTGMTGITDEDLPPPKGNKRRCQLCPKPNDCKSQFSCCGCKRCMCRKRAFLFCRDCVNNPDPATND